MSNMTLFGLGLMLMGIFLENWAIKEYQSIVDLVIFGAGFALLVLGNNS